MRVVLSMVELPLQSFDVCDAEGVTGASFVTSARRQTSSE